MLTPNLDALAASGTVFESAYASAAWTVPSLISLATGTFPHHVGVARWRHPFPTGRATLMSAFAAAGFDVRTAVHNRRWSFANSGHRGTVVNSQDPDAVTDAFRVGAGTDRFVFLHHWWTHLPYVNAALPRKAWKSACDAALEELGRDSSSAPRYRDAYHATVAYFDRELLPRYLDAAGGEEVLLVVTGDHGENWGESVPAGRTVGHMYDLHGRWLTDETLHVPLLLWSSSGRIPAGRLTGFVRGVDVAPTVAALAGVPFPGPAPSVSGPTHIDRQEPGSLDGRDLTEILQSREPTGAADAMTVTTSNAVKPPTYAAKGPDLWRRFSLRTAEKRYLYDGVDGTRDVSDAGPIARVLARWTERDVWKRLAAERADAVGAETLPKDLFPPFGGEDEEETIDASPELSDAEADALEQQMRLLGYMD